MRKQRYVTGLQLSLLFSGPLHLAHPNVPSVQWELIEGARKAPWTAARQEKAATISASLPRLQSNKKLRDTRTDKGEKKRKPVTEGWGRGGGRGTRVMDSVGCSTEKSRGLNTQTKVTGNFEKCLLKFHAQRSSAGSTFIWNVPSVRNILIIKRSQM